MFGFFKKKDKNEKPIEKNSFELFQLAKDSKDPKKSVELYSDAIDIEKQKETPNKDFISEIYQWRGELYMNLQVAILSSSDFLHSIEYNPKNAISHNNLAVWFTIPQFSKPDWKSSFAHFDNAIELAPDRLDFQMNRAIIKIKSGDKESGKMELEKLYSKGYGDAKIAMDRFL